MATASKFTPRKSAAKTAAKTAAPATPRKRVTVDPTAAAMHQAAGAPDAAMVHNAAISKQEQDSEEQVEVFVKKSFNFTTDDHAVHPIPEGTSKVPRSWLEHAYFAAHGVRETEKRK